MSWTLKKLTREGLKSHDLDLKKLTREGLKSYDLDLKKFTMEGLKSHDPDFKKLTREGLKSHDLGKNAPRTTDMSTSHCTCEPDEITHNNNVDKQSAHEMQERQPNAGTIQTHNPCSWATVLNKCHQHN